MQETLVHLAEGHPGRDMANLQAGPGDIKIAIGGIPGSCTTSPGLDKATRVIEMSMEIPAIPISRFLKAMASAQGAGSDLDAVSPVVEWWNANARSEEHTSELQSLMRISYAVFCLKKKTTTTHK